MSLFLLGLLTGFVEQNFSNSRMGFAAHLEGVMNGTFLVALGAIWTTVRLSPRWKRAAYWSALYGTYANWAVTLLAAIFGGGDVTNYRGRPERSAVAGGLGDRRLHNGGDRDRRGFDSRALRVAANHDVVIVDQFRAKTFTVRTPTTWPQSRVNGAVRFDSTFGFGRSPTAGC
jgi:hypothetical protein